jgi:hypothetical protein
MNEPPILTPGEQSFSEADIRSGSQEISRLSWKPRIHYSVQNSPSEPNESSPCHICFKIHLILISHLSLDLPRVVFLSGLPTKTVA